MCDQWWDDVDTLPLTGIIQWHTMQASRFARCTGAWPRATALANLHACLHVVPKTRAASSQATPCLEPRDGEAHNVPVSVIFGTGSIAIARGSGLRWLARLLGVTPPQNASSGGDGGARNSRGGGTGDTSSGADDGRLETAIYVDGEGHVRVSFGGQFLSARVHRLSASAVTASEPHTTHTPSALCGTWSHRIGMVTMECDVAATAAEVGRTTTWEVTEHRLSLFGVVPLPPRLLEPQLRCSWQQDGSIEVASTWTSFGAVIAAWTFAGWQVHASGYSRSTGSPALAAWCPGAHTASPQALQRAQELLSHVVVFDALCALCNASVDFIVRQDTHTPPVISFAAAQSAAAYRLLAARGFSELAGDLSSVRLLPADGGSPLGDSQVPLFVGSLLGIPWCQAATAGSVVPPSWRDWVYRVIGRNRIWLFGHHFTPRVPGSDERARFLHDGLVTPSGDELADASSSSVDVVHALLPGARSITTVDDLRELRDAASWSLVLVYAPWCGYCRALAPALATVHQELAASHKSGAAGASLPSGVVVLRGDTSGDSPGGVGATGLLGGGVRDAMSKLLSLLQDNRSGRDKRRRAELLDDFGVATFPSLLCVGHGQCINYGTDQPRHARALLQFVKQAAAVETS